MALVTRLSKEIGSDIPRALDARLRVHIGHVSKQSLAEKIVD
jgi:hypothetical protein